MSYPTKVAVVYHSGYGHTVKVAQAVAQGAASVSSVAVDLVKAEEAHLDWSLLDNADAIIMGTPTCMGSLSAPFKAFMDATSHLQYVEKCWANKIAAGFTNGASRGGDKQNSLVQLATFAARHQMHWVNLGLNYGNNRSYTNEDTATATHWAWRRRPTWTKVATSRLRRQTFARRSYSVNGWPRLRRNS